MIDLLSITLTTECAYHICVGSVGKCTKLQNYENNRNKINCLVLIIPTQIYIYKLILIKLCLTVNQIYDSLFMKHSIFVYIHLNLTLNSTHTHTPIKLLQSRTKYNARGVYLQIPKTKKNETGLLLRIAYLVPIFRLPLDELMALCKKRLSTTNGTPCQGVQCCSRVQLFTYETKRS